MQHQVLCDFVQDGDMIKMTRDMCLKQSVLVVDCREISLGMTRSGRTTLLTIFADKMNKAAWRFWSLLMSHERVWSVRKENCHTLLCLQSALSEFISEMRDDFLFRLCDSLLMLKNSNPKP